jgi:transglutaminase-like putative cysteine protease
MRLLLDHRANFRFPVPQRRVVQLLRLTPPSYSGQNVIDWQIDVDCDARLKPGRDGYGNETTMLYVDGPIDTLQIRVRGEVLTEDRAGMIRGAPEPLPPILFLRETPCTQADGPITRFAEALRDAGGTPLHVMHETLHALHAAVKWDESSTEARAAALAFADGEGSSHDLAHIMIAAARMLGHPARYVSGCIYRDDERGARTAAHGWAEVYMDGYGWIGFDATHDLCPNDRYVRMSVGLDAHDAAPMSAMRGRDGNRVELELRLHDALRAQ